jgi:hypothetical protein
MQNGLSTLVRVVASREFVSDARNKGFQRFSIPVSKMKEALSSESFPPNHTPQICNALRSRKFLETEDLELERTDGPPSLTSTTVVFHYKFRNSTSKPPSQPLNMAHTPLSSDPLMQMKGLLKGVFSSLGGGEAFLKSLREDPPLRRSK